MFYQVENITKYVESHRTGELDELVAFNFFVEHGFMHHILTYSTQS
jgi:hypothetical protein